MERSLLDEPSLFLDDKLETISLVSMLMAQWILLLQMQMPIIMSTLLLSKLMERFLLVEPLQQLEEMQEPELEE